MGVLFFVVNGDLMLSKTYLTICRLQVVLGIMAETNSFVLGFTSPEDFVNISLRNLLAAMRARAPSVSKRSVDALLAR